MPITSSLDEIAPTLFFLLTPAMAAPASLSSLLPPSSSKQGTAWRETRAGGRGQSRRAPLDASRARAGCAAPPPGPRPQGRDRLTAAPDARGPLARLDLPCTAPSHAAALPHVAPREPWRRSPRPSFRGLTHPCRRLIDTRDSPLPALPCSCGLVHVSPPLLALMDD